MYMVPITNMHSAGRIAVVVALEGSKCVLVAAGFLLFTSIRPFLPFFLRAEGADFKTKSNFFLRRSPNFNRPLSSQW